MRRRWFFLCVVALVVGGFFLWRWRLLPARPEVRAIWVTRFDYRTPEDVAAIFENVAAMGFTDIFFQVRGNGTVYFKSELEPWAYELSGGQFAALGQDPGWDPLEVAAAEARKRGVRIHAHVNALPGWKGVREPPVESGQLWATQRDWFMVDRFGQTMLPTKGWYAFLNPALPAVRKHLRGLVAELCRYDLDGIHLDYIRYPYDYRDVAAEHYPEVTKEELRARSDFSYDAATQAKQRLEFGGEPTQEQQDTFRRESVTELVAYLGELIRAVKPDSFVYSCSVLGNPDEGRRYAFQDSRLWIKSGIVDWIVPMNYNAGRFEDYLGRMRSGVGAHRFAERVVEGISCENQESDIFAQLAATRSARARGFSMLSYSCLFGSDHQITQKGRILKKRFLEEGF